MTEGISPVKMLISDENEENRMKTYELIAPCHFGLESVLKREIQDLGYDVTQVEDGKVTFVADADGIARANVFLRTAERVLIKVGKFKAETFDELFENTKALPWEEFLPQDGKFWVAKAASIKSKLFSPSDIQSIMKKAIVERMKQIYKVSWCPETGAAKPTYGYLKTSTEAKENAELCYGVLASLLTHNLGRTFAYII